jgi:hypothetical protein
LDLSGELVGAATYVGLLLLQSVLQILNRPRQLVDGISVLFYQVPHDTHALIEGLLHASHLVLQGLHLGLKLNDFLADAPGGRHHQAQRCKQRDGSEYWILFHSHFLSAESGVTEQAKRSGQTYVSGFSGLTPSATNQKPHR